MWIIAISALVFAGAITWYRLLGFMDDAQPLSVILLLLSGGVLLGASITMPISRMGYGADIEHYKSTAATVAAARSKDDISEYEYAALQLEIIKKNAWLARSQYWNGTIFGDWIPDAVDDLVPIE
jgi:hypothetical protein